MRFMAALLAGMTSVSLAHAQANDAIAVAEGNNQFAVDLYRKLGAKPGNTFFSPFSISTALGMAQAGARGQTAQEMNKTLHFTLEGDRLHQALGEVLKRTNPPAQNAKGQPFQLQTANAMWAAKDLAIQPDFLRITQMHYAAGLHLLDFKKEPEAARQAINRWVEDKTNDKIKDLLASGTIKPVTRLVLTNAIYFKGDWVHQFDKDGTRPDNFTIPGTPAFKVPMMNHVARYAYLGIDAYQMVQMPYQGNEVSMVVIVPKKVDGLAEVEKNLTAKSLQTALNQLKDTRLHIALPKFKMTEKFKLKDTLKDMGMPIAFSDNADFSGISSTEGLKIDDVIHKAFVAVDEKGTEAAAATAVIIMTLSGKPKVDPPIPVRADHPFLFLIRHNATGAILFMGRVHDPR